MLAGVVVVPGDPSVRDPRSRDAIEIWKQEATQ